jgi:SAM-dependent methyltransferase
MFKNWFRSSALDPLAVSMAGAKLGDRVLVMGCGDPRLIAALAAKAGLSGRTCAVDPSADRATEAGRVSLKEGVLVETAASPLSALPFDDGSLDLVVLRDVLGARPEGTDQERGAGQAPDAAVAEAHRVLRPGGRCMAIDTLGERGVAAILGGRQPTSEAGAGGERTVAILQAGGFVAVRVLAEREGLRFAEAVKGRPDGGGSNS